MGMGERMYFIRFIQWQNYAHYILLGILIFFWIKISEFIIDMLYVTSFVFNIFMVIFIIIGIFVIDSFIHAFFWFVPNRRIRWRD